MKRTSLLAYTLQQLVYVYVADITIPDTTT